MWFFSCISSTDRKYYYYLPFSALLEICKSTCRHAKICPHKIISARKCGPRQWLWEKKTWSHNTTRNCTTTSFTKNRVWPSIVGTLCIYYLPILIHFRKSEENCRWSTICSTVGFRYSHIKLKLWFLIRLTSLALIASRSCTIWLLLNHRLLHLKCQSTLFSSYLLLVAKGEQQRE